MCCYYRKLATSRAAATIQIRPVPTGSGPVEPDVDVMVGAVGLPDHVRLAAAGQVDDLRFVCLDTRRGRFSFELTATVVENEVTGSLCFPSPISAA